MIYHRYSSYREAREKRVEPWRWRLEWLANVEELERVMGRPLFSNITKMETATAIPAKEIKREMDIIYKRHIADHWAQVPWAHGLTEADTFRALDAMNRV